MNATTWPVLGIDPGGRFTGIVLRDRTTCIRHTVVERGPDETTASYLGRVIDTAATYWCSTPKAGPAVAVEDLNEPEPHMGITSLRGLIGTAKVLGAVLLHWPDATVVPPGGHGSDHLATYPRELVGERERSGHGRLKHARSAWDIAGAAVRQARLDELAARR